MWNLKFVFFENSNAGKAKLKKVYLLTLIVRIEKCNFLTLTSHYGKFNQENMYQTLSKSALFSKRYDRNIFVCFRFTVLSAVHLQKVSQGRVETLFRWGGKRLHFCTRNLLWTICTKLCHNRSGFVECRLYRKYFVVLCYLLCYCVHWLNALATVRLKYRLREQ